MFLKLALFLKTVTDSEKLTLMAGMCGQYGILRENPKGGLSKRSASFSRLNGISQKWDFPQNLNTPKQPKWDPI